MRFVIPKSYVEYVTVDSTLRQAIEKMRFHRYVAIPVLDEEGKYVGALRNDDVLKYILDNGVFNSKDAEAIPVTEVMEKERDSFVYHDASFGEIIDRVKEHNFVPVADDRGCFVGLVLRRDVLNYLLNFYNQNDRGKQ
jgi:CBS domain-containing protein